MLRFSRAVDIFIIAWLALVFPLEVVTNQRFQPLWRPEMM
jgi:hypothetical protein